MIKFSLIVLMVFALFNINSCKSDKLKSGKIKENNGIENTLNQTKGNSYDSSILIFKDDAIKNSGINNFRSKLFEALKTSNLDSVMSFFSEEIEFNPSIPKGKPGVIEIFGLKESKMKFNSFDSILTSLLSNGGCLKNEPQIDSTFSAPYSNCIDQQIENKCGQYGCGVITKGGAELYESSNENSNSKHKLNANEIIPTFSDTLCAEDFKSCKWTKVTNFSGLGGFIERNKILTKGDGFIWLVKENTHWKIRVLRSKGIQTDEGE